MLRTFIYLSFDKMLYLLKKIKLDKYLPRRITNNRFFSYDISYIKPNYIFFLKFKDKIYEYPLPVIMATIIKKGDIVVDIGANIGQYTIFLSKLVGTKGKVYAFEPDPRNFLILKHRIRKLKNVIIERKAVGNKKTKVKFYLDKHTGWSSIYKDATKSIISCLEIDMISLDEYFQDFKGEIALIKIDVQGSEPLVLDGMKNLIKKVKILIFEFWPYGLKAAGFEPSSLIEWLVFNNFKLIVIDENFNIYKENQLIRKLTKLKMKNIL